MLFLGHVRDYDTLVVDTRDVFRAFGPPNKNTIGMASGITLHRVDHPDG
jgi:hypothetical protein